MQKPSEPFKPSEGRSFAAARQLLNISVLLEHSLAFRSFILHACDLYILRTFSFCVLIKVRHCLKISHATKGDGKTRKRKERQNKQTGKQTTIHALTQCVCVEWMSVENTKIGSMKRFNLIQWSNRHLSAASRKDYLWSAQTHNV